jgi:exosortase/archaeosortase family protein
MHQKFKSIIIRYLTLALLGTFGLFIFYFIFAPLTIFPVYFLLDIFFEPSLFFNIILINDVRIILIDACIAGSAYYLLLILNLSTPDIKVKKRLNIIAVSFLTFLILNILRIFFLSLLYLYGSSWFDFTHKLFWYALSIVFVVGIWFFIVKKLKIKEIPFYSDVRELYNKSSLKN